LKNKNISDKKELKVKSRTENLSEIRAFIKDFASSVGFKQDTIDNMTLACDEVCTNIINHVYKF